MESYCPLVETFLGIDTEIPIEVVSLSKQRNYGRLVMNENTAEF